MKYVALLRGINVGGKSKISMAELKIVFEESGCIEVKTYINSGNVLFEDTRSADVLTEKLTQAIQKAFNFHVPVFITEAHIIKNICDQIPKEWANDKIQKTDVIFLHTSIDDPSILHKVQHKKELENVMYIKGALVWNILRKNATRGSGIKLIKSDLYSFMTVRNINTVRKLQEMLV